jgi:hypothetical protein
MKYLLMITALAISTPTLSATLYKCAINGVVSYQQKQCTSGEQTSLEDIKPASASIDAGGYIQPDISLSGFTIKEDPENNSYPSEYTYLNYKVTVSNNTDLEKKVSLHYKGIDNQDFLIEDLYLRGTVKAHSSETLTDRTIIKIDKFNRINKWVLDK